MAFCAFLVQKKIFKKVGRVILLHKLLEIHILCYNVVQIELKKCVFAKYFKTPMCSHKLSKEINQSIQKQAHSSYVLRDQYTSCRRPLPVKHGIFITRRKVVFTRNIFSQVRLSFLMVGHTHEDVDQV